MGICYDCIKAPAAVTTPCDGYIANIFDPNSGTTQQVRPVIKAAALGTYEFSFEIQGYSYRIYSSNGGTTWVFLLEFGQQKYSSSSIASAPCPPLSGWGSTPEAKLQLTSITAEVVPVPGEPVAAECSPSINVPDTVNFKDFTTVLNSFNDCYISKGTTYYNKISGGVPCDNRELSKMKLILRLLNEKDCTGRALECMYNYTEFPTAVYSPYVATIGISDTATKGVYDLVNLDGGSNDLSRFAGFTISIPAGEFPAHSFTILSATYNDAGNVTKITINPDYEYEYIEVVGTMSYTPTPTTYLDSFINFANKFCVDCITTPATPSTTTRQPGRGPELTSISSVEDLLRTESTGVVIELESLQTINLN